MSPIEKRKVELELMRVTAGRLDLEIRIEEMKEEINRLADHIVIQQTKEQELTKRLKGDN